MAAGKSYICPGETHPISASVHLARLAAYYPKCGQCPCRTETGALVRDELPEQESRRSASPQSIFGTEGVRGRYLSELTRSTASQLAAAFAQSLWEHPLSARRIEQVRPTIIVGYDERPSSPDLVAGVIDSLRRMGCGVIDVGPVSRPLLVWSVGRQNASGGLYVTGSGCDPAFTGIDFLGPRGAPLSMMADGESAVDLSLQQIERRMRIPPNRPTRSAGPLRILRDEDRYEESLQEYYHAIRPLRVVVGVSTRLIERHVRRVFDGLPCRLFTVELPTRPRDTQSADDPDIAAISDAVRESAAHLGILIADDGEQFALLDESGVLVPHGDVFDAVRLSQLSSENSPLVIVAADRHRAECDEIEISPATRADMYVALPEQTAGLGLGPGGRLWFNTAAGIAPVCDALVSLGRVLALLSRSDAECSRVLRQHEQAYGGS